MSRQRVSLRRTAWIALAAILLSLLPPMLAHGHGVTATFDGHNDFCSSVGAKGPAPEVPLPAERSHGACSHCDGCTGSSGSIWAPPTRIALALIAAAAPPTLIVDTPPAATPVELIAAPPRGPPQLA